MNRLVVYFLHSSAAQLADSLRKQNSPVTSHAVGCLPVSSSKWFSESVSLYGWKQIIREHENHFHYRRRSEEAV
jgi:hypothetical protein